MLGVQLAVPLHVICLLNVPLANHVPSTHVYVIMAGYSVDRFGLHNVIVALSTTGFELQLTTARTHTCLYKRFLLILLTCDLR